MRRQVLDPAVRFSCGSCTACCDQPWHTMIEPDKAEALNRHDFGAYPKLAGQAFYHKGSHPAGSYVLAKGEGTRCLFLDDDGLCIIHKELGPEAKPHMCRQFPFLPASTSTEDRVSANFGCPSVQNRAGRSLEDQASEIASLVGTSSQPADETAPVRLDGQHTLAAPEADALLERIAARFNPQDPASGDVWSRFSEVMTLLAAVRQHKQQDPARNDHRELTELLRNGEGLADTPQLPTVQGYPRADRAPMPVRFLFAANMHPDVVPADVGHKPGLFKRLTLVPKLMAQATLSGGYSSRLLGRNVSITDVLAHDVEPELDAPGQLLLLRYFWSRLWQRFLVGTRRTIIGGVHQHVLDFNAILFLARAEAHQQGASRLTEPLIRHSLTLVEFHIANQPRLCDQLLKGWLRGLLDDPGAAFASLRLMALQAEPAPLVSDDSTPGL